MAEKLIGTAQAGMSDFDEDIPRTELAGGGARDDVFCLRPAKDIKGFFRHGGIYTLVQERIAEIQLGQGPFGQTIAGAVYIECS
jgi:hypothetical protein